MCMSRVVVGAHYLGDSLAGVFIAALTTRYVARLFNTVGIDLAEARHGLGASGAGPPWPCRQLGKASIGRDQAGPG